MLSKALQIFVVVLFMAVPLTGCASTKKVVGYPNTSVRADEEKIAGDVAQRVMHASDLFEGGEYRTAERIYQSLLDEYSSTDGSIETGLLTNICMIYLETGERAKFKDCAERLRKASERLPYLSPETQMVFELGEALGNDDSKGKDLRIESRISDGLNEVFKEGR